MLNKFSFPFNDDNIMSKLSFFINFALIYNSALCKTFPFLSEIFSLIILSESFTNVFGSITKNSSFDLISLFIFC